jgi:Protein of unknown function (DUF1706)
MADKQKLLDDANEAYAELTEAVAGLTEADFGQVFLGVWGAREILIHIAGWDREMTPALERIGRGEAPYPSGLYDDADDWNARFVAARQGAKPAEILNEVDTFHRSVMAAAAALPEQHFDSDQPARAIFDGTTAQHYREHAGQIRDWRKRATR